MGILTRRCESCMRQAADVTLQGRFKQYAWCKACWSEMKALVQAGKFYEEHPELTCPVEKEKQD